jgi:hypothetical protein
MKLLVDDNRKFITSLLKTIILIHIPQPLQHKPDHPNDHGRIIFESFTTVRPFILFFQIKLHFINYLIETNQSNRSNTPSLSSLVTSLSTMTTFEVLSLHKATGEFKGVAHFPCRHMTSLCPDRCTHAQDAAEFKILEYQQFEKPGKNGDDKQDIYRVRIDQNAANERQDPAVIEIIKSLTPGQKVELYWEHIYVTDTETGSKYPERPVRSVEKI